MALTAEQLEALITAAEADPGQTGPLIDAVEQYFGEDFSELTQPEWDQVVSDGVARQHTISILGYDIIFTIDGTLVGSTTCNALTERLLPLHDQDFTLTPNITGTPPTGAGDYDDYSTVPSYEVHLEHPKIVYLNMSDPTDSDIWNDVLNFTRFGFSERTISGTTYRSVLRMNYEWSGDVGLYHHHESGGGAAVGHFYQYQLLIPPVGLRVASRDVAGGDCLPIDEYPTPLLGTSGALSNASCDPDASDFALSGSSMADWQDPGYDLSTTGQPWFFRPHNVSGTLLGTIDGAWDSFVAEVADWQAARTVYDPELIVDEENRRVTVRCMDYENALTIDNFLCNTSETDPIYTFLAISYGGWLYTAGGGSPTYGYPDDLYFDDLQERIITNDPPGYQGYTYTEPRRYPRPFLSGEFIPEITAFEASQPDGEPPPVIANPPLITPKPVSGGCKATMDGPSSCNFNVPVDPDIPDFPDPGDFVSPDIPDFEVPDMPVVDVDIPEFPPIDCLLPDLGNLSDCPPGPGSGAGLPGGRDRSGKRGAGLGGIKTGGPTYNNRDYNFRDNFPDGTIDPDTGEPIIPPQRSWPEGSSVMTAITVILLDLGISPLNIIFEVGPEWDKTFGPKTFPETTRMFDAAQWLASLIMCRIIDEGDGKVYIGPITHRPGQNTWTFNSQFPNADGDPPMLGLGYGASMGEAYFAVEVWGAHLDEPVFALVDTPFSSDPQNILSIEVGPDYSLAEAQDLAAFRAGLIRREAVMVQVEVPYSQEYFMRDKVILKFPDRGFQADYILFGKQSEVSIEKRVHILSCVLPATLEELENFPEVMGEGMDAIEMGFA